MLIARRSLLVAATWLAGCAATPESTPDAERLDTSAPRGDVGAADARPEARPDTAPDPGPDASPDASPDRGATLDALLDGPSDGQTDALDAEPAPPDGRLDAAPDAPDALDAAPAPPDGPPDADPPPPDAGPAPLEGWRLVWSDEFDAPADTPPDPMWWTHDVGGDGWGNQQLEFDTDRLENASHDGDGHLTLTARREAFGGRSFTSARIKTQGRFAHAYGRFEARIRLPVGRGIWPAFWLLGDDIGAVGWPACGEIDVMEFRGQTPHESTGAAHGPGHSAGASLWGARRSEVPLSDDFHTYAVEWGPAAIEWSVDGDVFHRVTPADVPPGGRWVYDHPFFVILNVAVGGGFVGPPDGTTAFPQTMWVDHVRVYERIDAPPDPPDPGDVPLPLTVDDHFVASGYMGDGAAGGVVAQPCPARAHPGAAGRCHGFRWTPGADGWAGVWWQHPANNWGGQPGLPIAPGAVEVEFTAWGAAGGEPVAFMAGYDGSDGFAVRSGTVGLTDAPTRYVLPLEGVAYDAVAGGFGWVTGDGAARAAPMTVYVDDIRWR